jgi:hypothetical protein
MFHYWRLLFACAYQENCQLNDMRHSIIRSCVWVSGVAVIRHIVESCWKVEQHCQVHYHQEEQWQCCETCGSLTETPRGYYWSKTNFYITFDIEWESEAEPSKITGLNSTLLAQGERQTVECLASVECNTRLLPHFRFKTVFELVRGELGGESRNLLAQPFVFQISFPHI